MVEERGISEWAAQGGKARANVLTADERQEIARTANAARWRKAGKIVRPAKESEPQELSADPVKAEPGIPYSMLPGQLSFGDVTLECHVLNDLRRVLTQREVVRVISGGRESGNLSRYLSRNPLFGTDFVAGPTIQFRIPGSGTNATGYEATLLIEICSKYLEAREQKLLKKSQLKLARQAEIIVRSCAKVGIIALIDEATGYQKFREKRALQLKLQAFIADDLQEWARMFPEEFWLELARLEGVHYSPRSRPLRWGKYVMAFVYDAVDKDIGKKLREINPNPHFKMNHHQWLKEFGRDKVNNQLQRVIGGMQTCETMDEFKKKFARVLNKTAAQLELFAELV
jgi:P63C domain-containing protein